MVPTGDRQPPPMVSAPNGIPRPGNPPNPQGGRGIIHTHHTYTRLHTHTHKHTYLPTYLPTDRQTYIQTDTRIHHPPPQPTGGAGYHFTLCNSPSIHIILQTITTRTVGWSWILERLKARKDRALQGAQELAKQIGMHWRLNRHEQTLGIILQNRRN